MIELLDLTSTPSVFFDFLPEDWLVEIEHFWPEYTGNSHIFALAENQHVIAGGIVFSTVSPDTRGYQEVAMEWFDRGYRYMGFIYVDENRRKEGLGSMWVNSVRSHNPDWRFWLAIDEYGLSNFYKKLGFEIVQEVLNAGQPEWILVEKS